MLSYESGLRMATLMKEYDPQIREAIENTHTAQHGVVALKFSNGCRELEIEILDEPLGSDVRIFPGDG